MDRLLTAFHVCFAVCVVAALAGLTTLLVVAFVGMAACLAAITIGGAYEVGRDLIAIARRSRSTGG